MEKKKKIKVIKKSIVNYQEALEDQLNLLQKRQELKIGDHLLLLQHPPVITKGKMTKDNDILINRKYCKSNGIEIHEIGRGGEATYHGPGQIVGYPILHIGELGLGAKKFVHKIEDVFINMLKKEFSINAHRREDYIGVWVGEEKITAIGVAIKKRVSLHGFAFNVNTDLSHFNWIVPCGIKDKGVTSMSKILNKQLNIYDMYNLCEKYFKEIFDYAD